MGDTYNLSGDFRDGVQNINCTFQLPPDEQKQFDESLKTASALLAALPLDTIPEVSHLPPGSSLPLRANPLFVGREEDIKALAKLMLAGGVAAVGQLVAAMGLGGIGKTQLASEFCHRYGQYFAGGVFWMSFADADQVPAEIARWRPRTGGCRIIVTSRRDHWDSALDVHPLPLGVMTRAESRTLLGEYRPDLRDAQILHAIAEALGDLPLALHLAGSYLALYQHSPLGDPARYLERLGDPTLLEHRSMTGSDGHSPTAHEQHVGKTFAMSWDQLSLDHAIDATALGLLSEAAVLAPGEPILRDLLLAVSQPEAIDEEGLLVQEDALQRLQALGLLQSETDGSLIMHRLVGLFVRQQSADWEATCERVESSFGNRASEINQQGLPTPLLPWHAHLKHLAEQAEARGAEGAGWLWNAWGYHLQMVADYAGARAAFERALAIDEAAFGPDHPDVARDVNNLGSVLQDLGDLVGARAAFERALGIDEAALGPDHPNVAIRVKNLGRVLQALGDLAGARAAYERALVIFEQHLGSDHPNVATIINNLGSVLHDLGDLAGARAALERALAIDEAAFGPDHPNVASYLNNLGSVLQALGDLAGAQAAYERALGIDEAAFGPDHPNVARDVNNLGSVLQALGDLAGARTALERALAISEQCFGPDHPTSQTIAGNLNALAGK